MEALKNREIKFRAYQGRGTRKQKGIRYIQKMFSWENISKTRSLHEFCNPQEKDRILMQYTGLKDKSGKDIYEGDIIKYKAFTEDGELEEMIKGVFFDVDFGCFMLGTEECMWNLATDDNKEIIGNIYENTDLLSSPNKGGITKTR